MNKLVSKNPVLRFKLGKKIVKALYSWGPGFGLGNTAKNLELKEIRRLKNIDTAINNLLKTVKNPTPSQLANFNRNPVIGDSFKYDLENLDFSPYNANIIISHPYSSLVADFDDNRYNALVNARDMLTNNRFLIEKVNDPIPFDSKRSYSVIEKLKTNLNNGTESLTQNKSNFLNNKSSKIYKGKSRKISITPSVFAGYGIGKTGGLNYNISGTDKLLLLGTNQFTEADFTNAMATLKALNRYFANSGLGQVKEDGYWGDLSRKALEFALSKSKSVTPFSNEKTVVKTPIFPTYTPPATPINLEVANLKLNVNVPQQTYNRTGVREFLRNKEINPYSFSGDLRRALRMVLNNTADDNDKLLVKGMGIFKQGGNLLPSRNIVKK